MQAIHVGNDLLGLNAEAGHLLLCAEKDIAHHPRILRTELVQFVHLSIRPSGRACECGHRSSRCLLQVIEAHTHTEGGRGETRHASAEPHQRTTHVLESTLVLLDRPSSLAELGLGLLPGRGRLVGSLGCCLTRCGHIGLIPVGFNG